MGGGERRTMRRKEKGDRLRGLHGRKDDGGRSSTSSSPTAIHCKYYWTAIASPISPMTWRHRWKNAVQSHSPYKPRREAALSRTTGGEWRVEDRRSKNEESE
ncbi:hypothetical protein SLA2020_065820 [Shorea laevis]